VAEAYMERSGSRYDKSRSGSMLKKKVCLLGTSGVGKTSLVSKFVHSMFSEKYHTTVGVKIDKKNVTVGGVDVTLMIWDLEGVDEFHPLRTSSLRDSSGCLLVADATRSGTLDIAMVLHRLYVETARSRACVLALNKMDLRAQCEVSDKRIDTLRSEGWHVQLTSAKTGEGVEDAFETLAQLSILE
jgi:small GTP-binding protein